MPQVYACEELYQKLDTEYQCPFWHQYNQSSDWPLLKVAVHKIFQSEIHIAHQIISDMTLGDPLSEF